MRAAGETIVIRADASATIGFGHVSRCLSLASALRRRGRRVLLRSRNLADSLRERAEAIGCECSDCDGEFGPEDDAAGRRIRREEADAVALVDALDAAGIRPAWIVVDGYGFGAAWHDVVRGSGARILCIDDLADRPLHCDLLLNHNLGGGLSDVVTAGDRYAGLLAPGCRTLMGPRFAMLPPEYAEVRRRNTPRCAAGRRVLISFGGADPGNATLAAVEAFARLDDAGLTADVVLPRRHPGRAAVESIVSADGRIRMLDAVSSLAPLLAEAGLCIGGAGVTALERLCLGVPSIAVVIADNQRPGAAALAAGRLARVCDGTNPRLVDEIAAAMRDMISGDHGLRIEEGMRLCDGQGAERVAAAMLASADMPLDVRAVEAADRDLVLAWANDPGTRRASLTTRPITAAEHDAWFARRLADTTSCLFLMITTADGTPVGNVRFEQRAGSWLLSFVLAPEFRGLGLGGRVVRLGMQRFAAVHGPAELSADVRHGNSASRRILESLGFVATRSDRPAIAASFRREVGGVVAGAEEAA